MGTMTIKPDYWDDAIVDGLIGCALAEDVGSGDATVAALGIADLPARAVAIARAPGVICGLEIADRVFAQCNAATAFVALYGDGDEVVDGDELFRVAGRAAGLLTAERVALNFLQRLSGIATLTRAFVAAAGPDGPEILDTRKTTPGLRILEKYAVWVGGGVNHRMGLYDAIMIKDSHKRLFADVAEAVRTARANNPGGLLIVTEAETTAEALAAEAAGSDVVMLDNFTPAAAAAAIKQMSGHAAVEISGGVNIENVAQYAAAKATRISVGALTHSARALDISLEVVVDSAEG